MRSALVLTLVALVGCSASKNQSGSTDGGGGAGGAGGVTATAGGGAGGTTSTGGDAQGGIGGGFGGQGGGMPAAETEVFGQSAATLYRLDPVTKQVTTVGNFVGCPSAVIDIAIDKDGGMIGTTFDGLYKIDKTTPFDDVVPPGPPAAERVTAPPAVAMKPPEPPPITETTSPLDT